MSKELFENTLEALKSEARKSWAGETGEQRAKALEEFLSKKLAHYSAHLGFSKEEILAAWEEKRSYSAINFYQESKFPSLDGVRVFENADELKKLLPSKKFRCPACSGESKDPYVCDTGLPMDKSGKKCDWKAFGLFGTLGKGLRFTFKDSFLENGGIIDSIFMPVDLEKTPANTEAA